MLWKQRRERWHKTWRGCSKKRDGRLKILLHVQVCYIFKYYTMTVQATCINLYLDWTFNLNLWYSAKIEKMLTLYIWYLQSQDSKVFLEWPRNFRALSCISHSAEWYCEQFYKVLIKLRETAGKYLKIECFMYFL